MRSLDGRWILASLSLASACTNEVWIDFPPGLERGSAIVTFRGPDAVHPFALAGDASSFRVPAALSDSSDLHIEALVYDRSLAALGIAEGRIETPAPGEPSALVPPWAAAYRIDIRDGRADGNGRAWTAVGRPSSDVVGIRVPFPCRGGAPADATEVPTALDVPDSVVAGQWAYYVIETDALDRTLRVELDAAPHDLDLYVSQDALPTRCSASCRSERSGDRSELCEMPLPGNARWYIGVRGAEAGPFVLRATRHGQWDHCSHNGVEDAGINSHQMEPPWCAEGTFLTQITQTEGHFSGTDAPVIGSVRCCGSGDVGLDAWTGCAWHEVETATATSLERTDPWCPEGKFLTQFDLDGGTDPARAPVVGRAHCCGLSGASLTAYLDCAWVPVEDSHSRYAHWCPTGAFLTQLDLDPCDQPMRCPVIGAARCCRPAL